MSSGFFSSRGFDPLAGRNIFGSSFLNNPDVTTANFYGLTGTGAENSPEAMKNVFAGLQTAYRGGGAPSTMQRWLQYQEPFLQSGWLQARQNSPSLSYADYVGSTDLGRQWDSLDPTTAGRSNLYVRSRFSGG